MNNRTMDLVNDHIADRHVSGTAPACPICKKPRTYQRRNLTDNTVIEEAIVDGYPWVNPPWGDPVNQTMLEDFRGGLVDSLHRHGLVITTRARLDELKSKEMVYEPVVRGLVDKTTKQFPEFVAALQRLGQEPR